MLQCMSNNQLVPLDRGAGMHYISAPVFGRPDAALEHRVLFAVAGAKEVKQQLQTYFDWMGRGILVCL